MFDDVRLKCLVGDWRGAAVRLFLCPRSDLLEWFGRLAVTPRERQLLLWELRRLEREVMELADCFDALMDEGK